MKTVRINNLFFNTSDNLQVGEEYNVEGLFKVGIVEEVYQIAYTYVLNNKPTMRKVQGCIYIPELVIQQNHKYYAKKI